MPARLTPPVTNETYHVLNRGVGAIPLFKTRSDYQRIIQAFQYYQFKNPPLKFSKFHVLPIKKQLRIMEELKKNQKPLVEVIAYCLMPNHFHFLLEQTKNNGITNFIRLTTNSYSRYFNTKYQRSGPLFESRFKAIRVETEEQLLHLTRYLHINPYSAFLVKDFEALLAYPFSSLPEYLQLSTPEICQKEAILAYFLSRRGYLNFIRDRANYQRTLETIKHQTLE